MRYLVFDISNVLYRTFFQTNNEDVATSIGLAHHMALMSMRKFFNKFKPDKVVMTFDRSSWRKAFTLSDECVSGKKYKGNRRKQMTPTQKAKFEKFLAHVSDLENIIREHTSVICLAGDGLEADDLMAGFCEAYGEDGEDEIILITRDRDMAQMLGKGRDDHFPNIQQWDPVTGKQVTIEVAIQNLLKEKKRIDHEFINVDFFMFVKKIRGDTGDNVQSSYPGIKRPRIIKAWKDPFEHENLMNHTWTNEKGTKMVVKELFNEGKLLMDLRAQPNNIRSNVFQIIFDEMETPGTFSYFHFMKFLGDNDLREIIKSVENFVPLLSR